MKRYILFLLLPLLLLPVVISQAQGAVTAVDTLVIDFWPDYDQSSVLILMSGTLPAGTAVPATVTLPLPEDAQLNAVAYLDNVNGMMNMEYTVDNDEITLTTPESNFRIEYYLPYTADGDQRSFAFSWTSDMSVTLLESKIQQPTAASSLITEPEATTVAVGDDGFTYHVLPAQTISAGQSFAINVNYTMTSSQLSANSLSDATIDLQPVGPAPTNTPTRAYDWPLIAGIGGGVLVIAALALLYFGNRPKARVRKPSPVRQPQKSTKGSGRFCHSCGEIVDSGDRFCRNCGTPVKEKA